jgi:hypothetical protein
MLRHSRYFISALGGVAALACLFVGLEVSATTAGMERAPHLVNRSLKGDRMPLIPESVRRNAVNGPKDVQPVRAPVRQEVLLDGCEAIVSPIAQSPLSQVPGRCVS